MDPEISLHSRETPFGPLRVTEKEGVRRLRFGGEALQGAMEPGHPETLLLPYSRAMMAFLLFQPHPRNLLLAGLGPGAMVRFLSHRLPRLEITAVELNAAVIEVAREYFGLPPESPRLRLINADALSHLARQKHRFDALLLDINLGDQGLDDLDNQALLRHCRRALRPGGVLAVNLLPLDASGFTRFLATLRRVFDQATLCLAVPDQRNVVALAFAEGPPESDIEALRALAERLEQEYILDFDALIEGLVAANPHANGRFLF